MKTKSGRRSSPVADQTRGFGSRRAIAPFSLRKVRLARTSTKRSMIWTMTLRLTVGAVLPLDGEEGLAMDELEVDGVDPRPAGGVIFSNVKAGMVHPLVVELKHSLGSP